MYCFTCALRNGVRAFRSVTLESLLVGVVNIRNVRSTPWCPETPLCTFPIIMYKYSGIGVGGQRLAITAGVMLLATRRDIPSATGLLTPRISSSLKSYSCVSTNHR